MEKDNAPGDHTMDMSNIEEEGNASINKASAEFSFEPTTMKRPEDDSQSENGKTHDDRGSTSDKGSFIEKWLQSVAIRKDQHYIAIWYPSLLSLELMMVKGWKLWQFPSVIS